MDPPPADARLEWGYMAHMTELGVFSKNDPWRFRCSDGTFKNIRITATPMRDKKLRIVGYFAIFTNVDAAGVKAAGVIEFDPAADQEGMKILERERERLCYDSDAGSSERRLTDSVVAIAQSHIVENASRPNSGERRESSLPRDAPEQ